MKLLINIGHGGGDPGAVNQALGITENEYNRRLAAEIAKIADVKVIEQDARGLNQLVRDMNALSPDLVVSLHCNATVASSATGTETLYWHTSKAGASLAAKVQANMVRALGLRDRGIKPRDNLAVLRGTKCPAIIVEPFFISNANDYAVANTAIADLAKAIITGVEAYVGRTYTSSW